MIDLPPITLEHIDQIIAHMSEGDLRLLKQYRTIFLSYITQHIIETMCRREKCTFDEFMDRAICHYVMYLSKKRRTDLCQLKNATQLPASL